MDTPQTVGAVLLLGLSASVAFIAAGVQGVLMLLVAVTAYLLYESTREPTLQRARGASFGRDRVSLIATEHLQRKEPLHLVAPPPARTTTFETCLAAVSNPDMVDVHAARMDLLVVPKDPLAGQGSDFAQNKRYVESTNAIIAHTASSMRPDMHIVYDEPSALVQHTGAPFTPMMQLDSLLALPSGPASRQWSQPWLTAMP